MTSIFLAEHERKKERAVTFLFLEILQAKQAALLRPDSVIADQLDLVSATLIDLGEQPDPAEVRKLFARLRERATAAAGEAGEAAADTKMGQVITAYLQNLDPAQLCMLASGFDLTEARRLYCTEDFESVQFLAAERSRWEMTRYYSMQEAVAIGFGGVPEGDDSAPSPAPRSSSGAVKVAEAQTSSLNDRLGFLRGVRH